MGHACCVAGGGMSSLYSFLPSTNACMKETLEFLAIGTGTDWREGVAGAHGDAGMGPAANSDREASTTRRYIWMQLYSSSSSMADEFGRRAPPMEAPSPGSICQRLCPGDANESQIPDCLEYFRCGPSHCILHSPRLARCSLENRR